MSDACAVIADVIRAHRIIRCSVTDLDTSQQWGMCDGCDFKSEPVPIKGVVWDVLVQDISAVHLAEMVDAALGGLTREISQATRNCSYPGGGGPCEGKHHGRWVTDWTPEERSATDD